MRLKKLLIGVVLSIFFCMTGNLYAKDLQGRLGVGFNSQLTTGGLNSISAKYWISDLIGAQGIFGFVTSDDYDEVDMGGKVLYKIKDEPNLHVDAFGGIGFSKYDPDPGDSDSGFFLSGGLAVEYFFSGLPNLGFSTELGIAFFDIGDDTGFGTTSDTFINAGIHYYFDLMAPSKKEPMQ